jgi:putative transposase
MRDTPCYRELPDKVAKQTIKKLYNNLNSNFKAIASFKKNPSKFKGKPKLPKYLDIIDGRFMVIYEKGAINRKDYKKNKTIKLSKTNIVIKPSMDLNCIKQIHLTKLNNSFVVNIIYDKKVKKVNPKSNKRYAGIDLGINNLITLTFEHTDNPLIYSGKTLKSINQG